MTFCPQYEFSTKTLFLFYVIAGSLAMWQHMAVIQGQTLHLKCPIINAHKKNVQWSNPDGQIMFFNRSKGESHIFFFHTIKYITAAQSQTFKSGIFNLIVLFALTHLQL